MDERCRTPQPQRHNYLINGGQCLSNTALAAIPLYIRDVLSKGKPAWTAGDDIYRDNAAAKFTKTQAGNPYAGVAAEDAASGAANG